MNLIQQLGNLVMTGLVIVIMTVTSWFIDMNDV